MSDNIVISPTQFPDWMGKQSNGVTGSAFDSLINTNGHAIDLYTFEKEFLPVIASQEEVPEEARISFIKRWIKYAAQPYNALLVHRYIDGQDNPVDHLFTVPPIWYSNTAILKEAAAHPPIDPDGKQYEKDPSLFRTLVARISQLQTANDQFTLAKHRDHFLPAMVKEEVVINKEHLKQWQIIFKHYGIENDLSKVVDKYLGGKQEGAQQDKKEEPTTSTVRMIGADDF